MVRGRIRLRRGNYCFRFRADSPICRHPFQIIFGSTLHIMLRSQASRTNTILYCQNWISTVAFYRDLLQLPVSHEVDWMVEFQLTQESFFSIADASRTTIRSAGGRGITISIQVHDLDGIRSHLNAAGVETPPIRRIWSARTLFFHDPEGHRIEIWA